MKRRRTSIDGGLTRRYLLRTAAVGGAAVAAGHRTAEIATMSPTGDIQDLPTEEARLMRYAGEFGAGNRSHTLGSESND